MLRFAIAVGLLAALALAGCTDACLQVQQVICTCKGKTQAERTACEDAASAQEALAPPTAAQLTACEPLITSCEAQVARGCETLDTADGRVACGLAPK
jgi:hypothetical protein